MTGFITWLDLMIILFLGVISFIFVSYKTCNCDTTILTFNSLVKEDKLLFRQVKKKNKKAFDTLFRKYYARLVRFGVGYVHDHDAAEEIVQELFVKIWNDGSQIEIESSFSAYMYRSVRNLCLNNLKHEEVKEKYRQEQKLVGDQNVGSENVNIEVFKESLNNAVIKLPDKCREIFVMAKFEGLSYDEIAAYLEVSAKTVENQMGIALKKLRESMVPFMNQIFE